MILATTLAAAALGASPALPLKPCTLPASVPARCGRLAVPEDRRIANGRKIKLFVAVVRAYGPKPHQAPVFYLSGGPRRSSARVSPERTDPGRTRGGSWLRAVGMPTQRRGSVFHVASSG